MITERDEIEAAVRLVAGLRALAGDSRGWVELKPGITDERLDAWPLPVPEDVRTVLRAFGGFSIGGDRDVSFDHPNNHRPPTETFAHQAGERGTYWVLYPDTGTDWRFYVDVDPATGRWGDVFAIVEHYDLERTSPSLTAWLERHLSAARRALEEYGADGEYHRHALTELFREHYYEGDLDSGGERIDPVPVESLRGHADPLLAEAAAGLPDGAFLADFRAASHPATAYFMYHLYPQDDEPIFLRLHGGALVAAVPG